MYSYIRGTLEEILPDGIVVENGGIGYHIDVPGRVSGCLPDPGEEVKIYTYLYVKEDCFLLFGFLDRRELDLFRMMLNVSGIGPKGALGILTALTPDELILAVSKDDAKAIAKAPGIGSKTAQKLIIELKDKVHPEDILPQGGSEEEPDCGGEQEAVFTEAAEALVSLGYTAKEARGVLKDIPARGGMSVEEVLKEALKAMAFL